jgi:hypothetical protein
VGCLSYKLFKTLTLKRPLLNLHRVAAGMWQTSAGLARSPLRAALSRCLRLLGGGALFLHASRSRLYLLQLHRSGTCDGSVATTPGALSRRRRALLAAAA